MRRMKILKFGGTSIKNVENINKMLQIVADTKKKSKNLIIIVSAFGGVTNTLIDLAHKAARKEKFDTEFNKLKKRHVDIVRGTTTGKLRAKTLKYVGAEFKELHQYLSGIALINDLSLRSTDGVMAFGERMSSFILSGALTEHGVTCKYVDSRTLVKTNSTFGEASVNKKKTYKLVSDYFKNQKGVHIAAGFVGSTDEDITTTIGRSGSDYTAALFGAALRADSIEIWTDVDGIMSSDPRKVPDAFPLKYISYLEASEFAHFGAEVIHQKTMSPARKYAIPIHIKNTFQPKFPGTIITKSKIANTHSVKGVSSIEDISLINIQSSDTHDISDIIARVFTTLQSNNINAILTSQASAEPAVYVALKSGKAKKAENIINAEFKLEIQAGYVKKVIVESDLAIIAIVGQNMRGIPGIAGRMFNTLGNNKINVTAIAQGSSELNISAVIKQENVKYALQVLHKEFFGQKRKVSNLFVVGTGLIGGTLLDQINDTAAKLAKDNDTEMHVHGISDAKHMTISASATNTSKWRVALSRGEKSNLKKFINQMQELDLPNKIFVDCTASENVAKEYENILLSGISVVTPNKKAMSGKQKTYTNLLSATHKSGASFLYETNVGAALPVLSTLKDLTKSGDKIVKIEAVLSGTLSYIFNTFGSSTENFSSIVEDAKKKGYTEPDPRDDLNGMDVARKILILAREVGLKMEIGDVKVKPLLPTKCFKVKTHKEFLLELKKLDADFSEKRDAALKASKVLRYIATLKRGKASVSLEDVDANHPFYNMSGSDNIISITSARYNSTPLVIKGSGAGAEVTAAGVLADIIRITI